MKNFVKGECNVTVAAPAALTAGKLVIIGSLIGVAQTDAASGANVAIVTEGIYTYAKASSLAISVGDKLYYDSTNNQLNKTASGNTLVGVAIKAAASNDATVQFLLDPSIN